VEISVRKGAQKEHLWWKRGSRQNKGREEKKEETYVEKKVFG